MNAPTGKSRDPLRGLRFAEPLESEFAAGYALAATRVAGPAVLLAVLLVGFWAFLDYSVHAAGASPVTIWVKLAVVLPALLAGLAGHLTELTGRAALLLAKSSAAGVAAGFVALLMLASPAAFDEVVLATHAATIYIYLLSGLRLLPAIALTLPLVVCAQWAAGGAGVPALSSAAGGAFLVVTNVVCALAVYRFEHAARSSFLEREVAAILNGNDAATGIPNRLSLERRYQLLARQGARDGKPFALLLADVDGFRAHATARGERIAGNELRRIAHAIVNSVRRPLDLAARTDDARFGILLYDVGSEHLPQVMRLIRENVALLDIECVGGNGPSVLSLTIGAALAVPGTPRDFSALSTVAELALEEARDPANHGIAVRAMAPDSEGDAVTTGPWRQLTQSRG